LEVAGDAGTNHHDHCPAPHEGNWDAKAAPQLRAEIERLRVALEEAQDRARYAEVQWRYWEEVADGWRDDALAKLEDAGKRPGLTEDGRLVAV